MRVTEVFCSLILVMLGIVVFGVLLTATCYAVERKA